MIFSGDLAYLAPEVLVAATGLAALMADLFLAPRRRGLLLWLSLAGLAVALWQAAVVPLSQGPVFRGMFVRDPLAQAIEVVAIVASAAGLLLAPDYLRRFGLAQGEFYGLALFSTFGAMLMAGANDLVMLFVGYETLSIPLYVLAGFARRSLRSQEAGMKYFLLGAFTSGFLLYGVALIYGATGATNLSALADARGTLLFAGVALLSVGFAFKAALVPFHLWTPDVYEGAPMPITAYMAMAAKIGAFAGLLRVFVVAFPALADEWRPLLGALAIVTMIAGNAIAVLQTNLKRLLAYSSIAHAGYLAIGVAAANPTGTWAVVYYLLIYSLMTLGAFAVVLLLERGGVEADAISDYQGVAARSPALGVAMAVFMASLAGLPPTAGFFAKFYIFSAALQANQVALAVVGVLTSVVSVYYYLRVPYVMFTGTQRDDVQILSPAVTRAAVAVLAAAVLVLGVFPAPLTDLVQRMLAGLR